MTVYVLYAFNVGYSKFGYDEFLVITTYYSVHNVPFAIELTPNIREDIFVLITTRNSRYIYVKQSVNKSDVHIILYIFACSEEIR